MIFADAVDSASSLLGVWIHNLDPEVFPIWGNLKVRWYGLAYLMGFVAAFLLLKWLAKQKLWVLEPDKVGDFVAYAAVFGVFVGGRLGYVLFYMIPEQGFSPIAEDPLIIFKVWKGGMASHGGILGLIVFTWFYARKAKVSWPGLGDGLVIVAPIGVCFGRIANFINGELYGRATDAVGWAMKFPKELLEGGKTQDFERAMAEAVGKDPERLGAYWEAYIDSGKTVNERTQLFEAALEVSRSNDSVLAILGKYVEARHPSQLYQALLEGLALCLILLVARLRWRQMHHGILTGLFFIFYAVFRIVAERFREPDSSWVIQDVLTKGQFYSVFMIAIGAAFLFFGLKGKTGRLGE